MSFNMRDARKDTNKFLELMDQGVLEPKKLAQDLLGWLSEADVHEFALANDYLCVTGEDEESTVDEESTEVDNKWKIVVINDVEVDCFLNGEFQHKRVINKATELNYQLLEIKGGVYCKFKDDDGFEFKLKYFDFENGV